MNKGRIVKACITISVLLVVMIFAAFFKKRMPHPAAQQEQGTEEGMEYLAAMREEVKKRDVPITFSGKVIDQYGRPVVNADVEIHLHHFSLTADYYEDIQDIHLKSDKNGAINLRNKKGSSIYMETIKCDGYEYNKNENPNDSFSYWDELSERAIAPDKTRPVVFRLRKKGEPTYLIEWRDYTPPIFYAKATDEVWYLDLVWPDFRPAHQTNLNEGYGFQSMYTDATVLVRSNQDHTAYNICFAVPDASDGIMETNVLMYTAPENGYRTNLIYSVPIVSNEMYETNTYFYVKSRGGKVYARIGAYFLSYGNDNNGVIVDFHTWANPYGERNLEAEPRLKYDTQQRLHDEAQAALLAGKLPPKPDIPKLLKTEGEYKE